MFTKKTLRRIAWSGVALSLSLCLLYSFRWTLLKGFVEAKIREVARKELKSDVLFGKLEGSLLFGIRAKNVIFVPGEGSPLKKATFGEISVQYGFLGMGKPEIFVDGALVMIRPPAASVVPSSPGPPSTPPHRIVQTVLEKIGSFEVPGELRLRDVLLVLADGREFQVDHAEALEKRWTLDFRSREFGTVEMRVDIAAGRALEVEGRASKGPLRRLQLSLGKKKGGLRAIRIETEYRGRRLSWNGKIRFREDGTPHQVEGKLAVREGNATALIDFERGTGIVDVDAEIALEETLEGIVKITGRGEGPLDGTAEEWIFSDVLASSNGFYFQSVPFERLTVRVAKGRLSHLSWEGELVNGEDRVTAEGTFRWGDPPRVTSNLRAELKRIEPYLPLFPPLAAIETEDLRIDGAFLFDDHGPTFEGDVTTGAGHAYAFDWRSLQLTGRFDTKSVLLKGLTLHGTPVAPRIDASGSVSADGYIFGQLRSDEDQIDIAGRISEETGIRLEYMLEGPMSWLEYFKIDVPGEAKPFSFHGTARGSPGKIRIRTAMIAGDMISATPAVEVSREAGLWNIVLSPGTVFLREKERIHYGAGHVRIRPGYLSLSEVPISIDDPELGATVWAQGEWDGKKIQVDLHLKKAYGWGMDLGTVRGFGGYRKESGNLHVNLNWGDLAGDHLFAAGTFGESNDFQMQFRVRHLDNAAIRDLLPGVSFRGEASLRLTVSQGEKGIEAEGSGILEEFSIQGSSPVSLEIPVTSGGNSLRIPEREYETPYGTLTIGGKVPLPWTKYAGDLDLAAKLDAHSFSPFFAHVTLPEEMEEPRGHATVEATVRGSITAPVARLHGEVWSSRSVLPPPLGELSDVHLIARYDGKRFSLVDGTGKLGGGAFHLSGEWTVSEPSLPLRLRLQGEELLAVQEDLARIRINPDVEVRWNLREGCRIRGDVEIPLALYYREFGPRSEVVPSRTGEAVVSGLRLPPSPGGGFVIPGIRGLPKIALDLNVKTTGECRIENSEIGVLVDGKVRLRGTILKPALSGTLEADRGEIRLSSGIFLEIDSARVVLPAGPNEEGTIQFKGTIGQGEGRISVILSGPISLPRLNLQSHPPRPQQELLARVAFGQSPGALSDTGALGTLAVKVFEQISDDWPRADPSQSLFGRLKLTIIDDDIASERTTPWELPPIGGAQGTRVRTEYLLNSFFSIIAESDESGNVNGDLKVRLNFR